MKSLTSAIKDLSHILDSWLPIRVQQSGFPGLSIAIAHKGVIVYARGFGFADKEKKSKATEKTLYHIASISKTFTSVAILQLAEKGLIGLNDKVSKHVKDFRFENKVGKLEDITIKQLLSNSSGVWRDGDTPHWTTGEFPKTLKWSEGTLIYKPSKEFKYSNFGFSILGEVIRSVTGMAYEEYVQKNILDVLNLTSTHPDYNSKLKDLASGYGKQFADSKREKFRHFKTHAYAPATGFISNAIDLAKYAFYLSPQADESILKNDSKNKMMRPIMKSEGKDKYCLGLEKLEINKRKVYSHSGGFQGFTSDMIFDPVNEVSVAILINTLHAPASFLTQGVLQIIYNLLDNKQDYYSGKAVNYGNYEGVYRNLWGDNVIAKVGNSLISFNVYTNSPLQGKNKYLLTPTSDGKFVAKGGNNFHSNGETVSFRDKKGGKYQTVSFGPTPAKRIV